MARNTTLKTLRLRIRELGEIRESYVTNIALDREIESSRLELVDKLVSSGSNDYEYSTANANITSGTNTVALPSDFYKLLGVDVLRSDGSYSNLQRYNWGERNRYNSNSLAAVSREFIRYRINGSSIHLAPTPQYTETNGLLIHYVPVPTSVLYSNGVAQTDAQAANTNIDGIFGWEDWIVYDCLIKFIGGKEEGDSSEWQGLLAKLNNRIEEMISRDRGDPDSIRNTDDELEDAIRYRYGTSV